MALLLFKLYTSILVTVVIMVPVAIMLGLFNDEEDGPDSEGR